MESKPRADLDIFPKLAAYLDPHLVIPVLESDFYRGLQVSIGVPFFLMANLSRILVPVVSYIDIRNHTLIYVYHDTII